MPDASSIKWHLAHTTWFWETFILVPFAAYPANLEYGFLFNSYYDAIGPRHARPLRGLITSPSLAEILVWRSEIDHAMQRLFESDIQAGSDLLSLIALGLAHEEQHQELMVMDLKHLLACHPFPTGRHQRRSTSARETHVNDGATWFDGGLVSIGHHGTGFAFDNEGPRHKVWLEPFGLANRTVTNADWQRFIDDAGYHKPELWLAEGWVWKTAECVEGPLYWQSNHGRAEMFTLGGLELRDPGEPVCHISFFEAAAFAEWAGGRLPSEAEWEHAAVFDSPAENFLDPLAASHPTPSVGPQGLQDMFGNVWEWTRSDYAPFPGFHPASGAVGEYNGKFMSGQRVLKGGCCATPKGHIRASYRNFFPPTARWPFTGLRLAWDA